MINTQISQKIKSQVSVQLVDDITSMDDREIVACFLVFQEMSELSSVVQYLVVEH